MEKIVQREGNDKVVIAIIESYLEYISNIFSMGAQDYITSPIIPAEIHVRIKSNLCPCKIKNQKEFYSLNNSFYSGEIKTPACSEAASTYNLRTREEELVQKTCIYLLAHLSDEHSLADLSFLMITNRNTLALAFKKVMNKGVFLWLREQRMKKAEILLSTTTLSIQEISFEVGYQNPANFSTTFKKYYSVSPRKYGKNDACKKNHHGIKGI